MSILKYLFFTLTLASLLSCSNSETDEVINSNQEVIQDAVQETFGDKIDLNNLPNYANQEIPDYINEDNTRGNEISDAGAILGRVLFYDKNLSNNNTVSCASCHKQEFAFGDDLRASVGVNGTTGRHSMRLVNSRFAEEDNFFWDERANSLEEQTTMPIQDHVEMGFSGNDGDPSFNDLAEKLESIEYYNELFTFVYGDESVSEARMQNALAQFIRSIQSFDSKYDIGRAQVNRNNDNLPNLTTLENEGRSLFMGRPNFDASGARIAGGLGCDVCHRAPEFDIDPNSDNNGVIASIAGNDSDLDVTRSPSLRDLFNSNGEMNGPSMHTGDFDSFEDVLAHYNNIDASGNNNLDGRLANRGQGQNLNMTTDEIQAVVAFIKTLSGSNLYTDVKWSDPFAE
ncbi:MAG: cytochrome-c peroxidase [Ekhidna sp.]